MENNNHKKRKVMLIAAFAVAVIALAGIGYATVTGYKATTVNSNNSVTGVSFTAEQLTGNYVDAFDADDLMVNTYTDASHNGNTTLYTITGTVQQIDTDGNAGAEYYGVQIGGDLDITLSGNMGNSYIVTVTAIEDTDALATEGWTYIMKINDEYVVLDNTGKGSVTINDVTITDNKQTVTAKLYIASDKIFENWTPLIDDLDDYKGCPTAQNSPLDTGVLYDGVVVAFTFEVA